MDPPEDDIGRAKQYGRPVDESDGACWAGTRTIDARRQILRHAASVCANVRPVAVWWTNTPNRANTSQGIVRYVCVIANILGT